jgi:hypothetical protein
MSEKKIKNYFDKSISTKKDVTFRDAKSQSIHRWFPYLEGFSETFIEGIISNVESPLTSIYEPFAGSGTLPVYALQNGFDVFYCEVNPFLSDLIDIKIRVLSMNEHSRSNLIVNLNKLKVDFSSSIKSFQPSESLRRTYNETFPNLIYFKEDNFIQILQLKSFIETQKDEVVKNIIEVACCESLLNSSLLKRSGDIRYRKGKELDKISDFIERTSSNLEKIIEDLSSFKTIDKVPKVKFTNNAKVYNPEFKDKIDIVITSPPYLNGTNYIRNAKLELWFLGYLKTKKDLSHYRKLVVTAGINDVGSEKKIINLPSLKHLIENPDIWYDKRIPKMINDYFFDMELVLRNSFNYLKKGGRIYIDIGDSIYGGIHIPTDEILIELSKNIGYKFIDNVNLRVRKSKSGALVKQTLIIAEKV